MANDLTGPVWKIDTPAVLTTKLSYVRGIRWVSKTATAGDVVEIQDSAGRVIWTSVASGANYVEADNALRMVDGFQVTILASGTLYLEVG